MTDQDRPDPFPSLHGAGSEAADPVGLDPFGEPTPLSGSRVSEPAAAFAGRTPRNTAAVRVGMLIGTGLVVALGAAVAMGASPSPAASAAGAAPSSTAGQGADRQAMPRGVPFGDLGPFGFGPDAPGEGFAGSRGLGARGFHQVTVTAISGSSVSLATEDGWTRTISVTGSTTITKGGAAATLSDLAVGDVVRFAETRNSDGSYAITKLEIVQPRVAGTVSAVDSASITITRRDGTSTTVRTTASTTYHLDDAEARRSDVTVGSMIVASGTRASDGSLTASAIWVRLPRLVGTVTKASSDSLTLTRRDGTAVTVHVTAGTAIRVAGVDGATLSDIRTGMVVMVEGPQRADGSIDAREIAAGERGLGKGLGNGRGRGWSLGPGASSAPSPSGGSTG